MDGGEGAQGWRGEGAKGRNSGTYVATAHTVVVAATLSISLAADLLDPLTERHAWCGRLGEHLESDVWVDKIVMMRFRTCHRRGSTDIVWEPVCGRLWQTCRHG